MKLKEIDLFLKTKSQIKTMYKEISELSKKKPNDAVNIFKLNLINKILKDANQLLKDNYKPFDGFEIFDEDKLPSNSDVTIVLSQYLNAMEILRCDNIMESSHYYYWKVDGKISNIKTDDPLIREKRGSYVP